MKYIVFYILLLIFWMLITLNFTMSNIIVGALAALLTTWIFARYFFSSVYKFFQPKRYFWLIVYFFIFTWECIKANFDVAYRVLHPAMPIKPGIVKLKTGLKSEFARIMLANSITMTPGTITVDIIDDTFYIHWIYISSDDPEVYAQKISGRFEKYIKRIFE